MIDLPISRRWRSWKAVWGLFGAELIFTVPALALFAIAQPDLYRTKLWQFGFDHGFNSNPVDPIYAMVNQEPYTYPLVWQGLYVGAACTILEEPNLTESTALPTITLSSPS